MEENEFLAERFEENRTHLRAVAYRMLGSLNEADDAVQEAWLRLSRRATDDIENLPGWLTTIVSRVCLDMLRSRSRHEEFFDPYTNEPIPVDNHGSDPEQQVMLADSVGLALLVVLDTLDPAERLAFVLHDMFAVPFDEIAGIVERTPTAARKLASRARRRIQGAHSTSEPDQARQREVVEAFLAAARGGNFEALLEVLDPDIVARSDGAPVRPGARGAMAVARQAVAFAKIAESAQPALVNGLAGVVADQVGQRFRVMTFVIVGRKIVEIDVITDPALLRGLDLAVFD
jgi:RNA polymerase sigma factor (sigma-70 family)